jgi:hypothetical protein
MEKRRNKKVMTQFEDFCGWTVLSDATVGVEVDA